MFFFNFSAQFVCERFFYRSRFLKRRLQNVERLLEKLLKNLHDDFFVTLFFNATFYIDIFKLKINNSISGHPKLYGCTPSTVK